MLERQFPHFAKILEILGIGEWISALDVIHAQLVKAPRDKQLVLQGEIDSFPLTAVSKRGVVDMDACHRFLGW